MSLESIRKKINIKTFMGQSEALVENTETLKSGVKRLFTILTKKKKISPETLLEKKKTEEVKKISVEKEKENKKKGGFDLKPLIPLLAGLGALGAITGLAILDPKMFLKRFGRATLKAIGKLIKGILKTFKRIVGTIGDIFKKIFNAIADNVKKLKNLIDDKLLKPIREAFENAINSKWFKKLRSFFDDIGTSIKNFIKNSAERFKTFADDIFKKIKTFVGDFTEKAIRAFKGILDNIVEKILKPLKKAVKEFAEKINKFIKEGIQNVGQNIAEKVGKKSFGEVIEFVSDIFLNKFDNTVDFIVDGVRKPVDFLLNLKLPKFAGPLAGKGIESVPFVGGTLASKLGELSSGLDSIGGSVKSTIREVPKTISGLIDDFAAGKTPVNELINFVGNQFKPETVLRRLTKAGSFVRDVASVGGEMLANTRDKITAGVKNLDIIGNSKKILESVGNSIGGFTKQFVSEAKEPLEEEIGNIFKGATSRDDIINASIKTAKVARDVKPGFKATSDVVKKIDPVAKNVPGLGAGWRSATTKFDQIFAVLEAAGSYGLALETQRRKEAGEEGISLPVIGEVQGQTLGTSILTAAGGFLGSAIGSQLGTSLGSLIAGGFTVGTAGIGAIAIPATIAIFGGLGTVLGGILGEDLGKLASTSLSANNIPDPLLKDKPFFQDARSDMTILNMFMNMGEKETPELEPQGGFNAGPVPRSVPMNRDFETLEEYSEIYEADLVIVKQTEIVNRVQKPVTNNSSSNLIILSDSIDSLLNNFRDRSLTQLSYS